VTCNLLLTVYNAGEQKGLLLLEGGPNTGNPKSTCPIEFGPSNGTIPANYVRSSRGTALEFNVPQNLLHPAGPGVIDNAVIDVKSEIDRKVRRGKGYYESRGGCVNSRRGVTVTFTPESGSTARAQGFARCTR
jgi:hypothetical protein